MELLIPGLIIVALMVWASTKIKKAAAKAYEEETVETELFSIFKPAGFINPVGSESPVLFEAYTKEFGTGARADERLVAAEVRFDAISFHAASRAARKSLGGAVVRSESDSGSTVEGVEGGDTVYYKTAPATGGSVTLRIRALGEPDADNEQKIREMLESFRGK